MSSSSTFFVLTSWLVFLGLVSAENSPKDQVETTINLVNEELEELNSRFERVRGFFLFFSFLLIFAWSSSPRLLLLLLLFASLPPRLVC